MSVLNLNPQGVQAFPSWCSDPARVFAPRSGLKDVRDFCGDNFKKISKRKEKNKTGALLTLQSDHWSSFQSPEMGPPPTAIFMTFLGKKPFHICIDLAPSGSIRWCLEMCVKKHVAYIIQQVLLFCSFRIKSIRWQSDINSTCRSGGTCHVLIVPHHTCWPPCLSICVNRNTNDHVMLYSKG